MLLAWLTRKRDAKPPFERTSRFSGDESRPHTKPHTALSTDRTRAEDRLPRLGKLKPPYPYPNCASNVCQRELSEDAGGAFLFKDQDSDKLCVLCEDCAADVEINFPLRFKLVAL